MKIHSATVAAFGLLALALGCHGNGPPAQMPNDPMYPGGMNYRTSANRSAARDAQASCTSATEMRSTPSGCRTDRDGVR